MKATQLAGLAFVAGLAGLSLHMSGQRLEPGQVRDLVRQVNHASFAGWFNEADVLAIVEIESGFRPNAARWEAHKGEASMGLMQILLSSARDRGYRGCVAGLLDPETNIRFGMAHLKWGHDYLLSRRGREPEMGEWIGAYNAGVGNVMRGNLPMRYVSRWVRARDGYA